MIDALFAAAVAATAAASQVQPPPYRPDWLRRPSGDDVASVYPMNAQRRGVSGRGEIACLVAADGRVYDCKVLSEEPAGFGFGDAALRLARYFQMRPGYEPGNPDRPHVNIPIRFIMYGGSMRRVTELQSPAWTSAPTFADVARAYPAKGAGAVGLVTLQCRLGEDGAVKDACETQEETPRDKGFARSARELAPLFRIDPGADVLKQGKTLWVTLTFRLTSADSDDLKSRRIADPRWVALPAPRQVAQLFPAQAAAKGLTTGRGVASCRVSADGTMTDCKPLPGEPDGLGFSQSAVVMASAFRMSPWTNGGGPVDGAIVNLPIRFDLAPDASAPPAAKP